MSYEVKLETLQSVPTAVVSATLPIAQIGPFIGEAFGAVMAALQQQGTGPAGPPFARYHMQGDTFVVSAGFPVPAPITASGRVTPAELPGGQCAVTTHVGPYDGVAAAYTALMSWLPEHGLAPAGDPWETYLDGPEVAQPRTVVRQPVQPLA